MAKTTSVDLQVRIGVLEELVRQLTQRVVYLERQPTQTHEPVNNGTTISDPNMELFEGNVSEEEFRLIMGGVPTPRPKPEEIKQ